MRTFRGIYYINDGTTEHTLDLFLPDTQTKAAFIYFHGGGLENGTNTLPCDEFLTKKGITVIASNYRKYPTAKYPDYIEDSALAVAWAFENAEKYGIPKDKIFVGGSSAGGYISSMLCFDPKYLGSHGIKTTDIAGFVHDAGQLSTHFNVLKERGISDGTKRVIVDEAAPLYYIGLEKQYSPMIFLASDHDMPNRIEQTMLAVSTLRHFGHDKVEYRIMENTTHCSYNAKTVFGEIIADFIEKNT